MSKKIPITVAHGDGIGPEIMEASLHVILEAGAALEIETVDVGEKVARLGQKPEKLKTVSYPARPATRVDIVGADLYLGSRNQAPQEFGDALTQYGHAGLELKVIDSRGTIEWPGGMSETFVIDNYRCRFEAGGAPVTHDQIAGLCSKVTPALYDIVKTESLRNFDGKQGFTLAQGQ